MDIGLFFRVLWRQRAVLLGGLVAAIVVGTLVAYRPTSSGLAPRAAEQYQSSIRLLVSAGSSQIFSSSTPQSTPSKNINQTPNFSTGDLADIYSQLIMSDTIKGRIEKIYGSLAAHTASVAAFRVLAQSPNGFGVSRPRPLPLIEVDATADSPKNARVLAQVTGDTFIQYINEQENATQVAVPERITVTETNQPQRGTLASSNPLILVGLVVGGMFVLLIAIAGIRHNLTERRSRRAPTDALSTGRRGKRVIPPPPSAAPERPTTSKGLAASTDSSGGRRSKTADLPADTRLNPGANGSNPVASPTSPSNDPTDAPPRARRSRRATPADAPAPPPTPTQTGDAS